ncbi:biotin-independent malonate decarboxylase subunit gamma [Sphingomonas aurantiaca]|uniref:Malonate decarboxylase gamma subunit n=1 Tax=Sphingomonas aurantiaca TaxID=185949 RepID=A0A2T5GIY5_9SPHN|nr:biotin-independent malonate decarboxylase subunit gamma [Sphingomonas aurantiaca]PTQ59272.1 malonate decarboxylase gamma subunit [Sphingomonas aurantiaca]
MTPAEILDSLFPAGHDVTTDGDLLFGRARFGDGIVHVVGATGRAPIGIDQAIRLSAAVLQIASSDDAAPILFLVDSASQRMSRRDELLGLSEYLAHLAKSLLLAEARGHRTIGLLYGGSAAGAFIATALACGTLVALPGAHPEVMDLASMARVTKLPIDVLEAKAKTTPVFAPGLDNLVSVGGIATVWDAGTSLADQLQTVLATPRAGDDRATLGAERGGRPAAARIAGAVATAAQG